MFKERYDHFSNEVQQATACYVIWKNLQNEPAKDKELLKALNNTPKSWIAIRHSMMLGLIMTLGRIFDDDGESIHKLLKSCIEEIHLFSKESLRQRKLMSGGLSPEELDEYIDNIYEPKDTDFLRLKSNIQKFKAIYQKFYQPIRHKLFSHRDKEHLTTTDQLWDYTKGANMEEMLNFISDFDSTIWNAYNNGRKPVLSGVMFDEEWFEKDIISLLSNVKMQNNTKSERTNSEPFTLS